jgi:dienelactone hydrolase
MSSVLLPAASNLMAQDKGTGRLPRDQLLLFRNANGGVGLAQDPKDWEFRRAEVLEGMRRVMGTLPGPEKHCPLDPQLIEEVDIGSHVRRLLSYQSEPACRTTAYLLVPKKLLSGGRAPGVLCLHGTNDTIGHGTVVDLGTKPNRAYASELTERGYVTIAPSYPRLAQYQPDLAALGWESGTLKAVWDNMRALDLLESLDFVDASKGFATIGHSLGGHNSVYTAVLEPRIKAVVSSCGLDSYLDYYDGSEKNWYPERGWCQTRYMLKLASYRGRLQDIPFDFHELIGALAPRSVLIIAPTGDSNFRAASVDRIARAAQPIFLLHGQPQRLKVVHPECDHDFPPEMRQLAYEWIDKTLR